MSRWVQDFLAALRSTGRNRSLGMAVVLILALGLGATYVIVAIVDSVLLRPLPFPDPDRLAVLWTTDAAEGNLESAVSGADFADWRAQAKSFEELAAYHRQRLVLTGDGPPEQLQGVRVTPGFFELLGARLQLGTPAADESGSVILSQDLWQRRFGADPSIVGRSVQLDGESRVVTGVLAENFYFPIEADAWIPLRLEADERENRGARRFEVLGRLHPGVSLEQARAEMDAIAAHLESGFPETNSGAGVRVVGLLDQIVGRYRVGLWILLGAVGLLLVLASINVVNLLLAGALMRRSEFAIRTALGAASSRLRRQLVFEAVFLATAAGLVGLALAGACLPLLIHWGVLDLPRIEQVRIAPKLVLFALALAWAVGVVVGGAAALRISSAQRLHELIREAGRRSSQGRAGLRLQSALVVLQLAMALMLLHGAGLMVRTFVELQKVDTGFRSQNLLTFNVQLPPAQYRGAAAREAFFGQALERIRHLPGVTSVGGATTLPLEGSDIALQFVVDGRVPPAAGDEPVAGFDIVTPGYFETLGISLLEGRTFDDKDRADAAPVILVNQTLARQMFGGDDPVGQRIHVLLGSEPVREIVGVVADIRHEGLTEAPGPALFLPFAQKPQGALRLAVRSEIPPKKLVHGIQGVIAGLDPEVPLSSVQTMAELKARVMARETVTALLLTSLAIIGLIVASVGVYSLTSYGVARRRREIAIRMAFGADRRKVVGEVLLGGLRMAALGLALGILASLVLTKFLSSLLYGVSAYDPLNAILVSILLLALVLVASILPARRASSVEPTLALRTE